MQPGKTDRRRRREEKKEKERKIRRVCVVLVHLYHQTLLLLEVRGDGGSRRRLGASPRPGRTAVLLVLGGGPVWVRFCDGSQRVSR